MLLEKQLIPDYMFDHYHDVTPTFLHDIGVCALLIDIDNTLAPYEQPDPDARHYAWVAAMRQAGIALAFVSNNHRERVERFAAPLGVDAYWDAHKPLRKTLDKAMAAMGSTVENTAMLGDQLLTDAYAGKHIGLRTLIVLPIRDKRSLFVRFKRRIERPYLRRYRMQQGRPRQGEED